MQLAIDVRADGLAATRSDRGVTQRQFAVRVGVTPAHLSAIEAGYRSATPELRPKLMAALDVPFSTLFRVVIRDAFGRELPTSR